MAITIHARAVLELGSEIMSSDIIAFYELITKAFYAAPVDRVEIYFEMALRRNA
jgi:hypothetical protein